ncbi:MAG: hypothetical protein B7Y39_13405 [Bdellovibrio sp. 28-41-41]|nr:MAG: hypothetical protein B7Y39_13405 [Bdellovibrio sp. 28-41-41]
MKLLAVVLMTIAAQAEVVELSFPKDLKKYKFENVYENPKLKGQLSAWRRLEIDKKYKECITKGPSLVVKNKVIDGWILNVWSSCVFKGMDDKFDQKVVQTFLDNIKLHSARVLNGPWRSGIVAQTQKIIGLATAAIEKDPKKTVKLKAKLISFLEMDEVYHNVDIKRWYQAQLDLKQPTMTMAPRSKIGLDSTPDEDTSGFKKIMSLEDAAAAVDLGKTIVQIESVFDSMKSVYRKMDYKKLVDLGPRLESYFKNSELYRDYAMMLARSFEFTGEYGKSLDYFKIVLNFYVDSPDFEEALFRSGLVCLRKGDYADAQKYFQRLVQIDRDKYDITGRYWWLRTLQYNKDPRELDEKNKFANDFPFSYYGLRIKAELNDGKLKATKGSAMPAISWALTGKSVEVWARFVKLSELGWVLEAQTEMQNFSWPTNPLKVFYLSMVLSRAGLHPLTVKNVTPLLESYNEVRSIDAIKEIYPKTYLNLIVKEKDKYPLHEHIILSLIRQESSFGLKALSTSQAAGLMQMIQPTAMEVADRLKMKIDFPEDLYRPEINIPMGVFYIHQVIKEMSYHIPLALAGYNAGPHKIRTFINQRDITKKIFETGQDKDYPGMEDLWIDELPWAETTGYVKSILRNALIYELIAKGEFQYRPDFWRDFILK